MAVKADLGNSSTEIVVGVVVLIASTIEIIKELVVFIGYKASELEIFGVVVAITIAVAGRVRKGIEIIGQQ